MPIIAQLFLPAVLIYCGAQRRKRQVFFCKLLGTGRKQERFQKEKTEQSYWEADQWPVEYFLLYHFCIRIMMRFVLALSNAFWYY